MKADTSISPGHHQLLAVFSQDSSMLTGWRVNTGEGARKARTCTRWAEPLTENYWTTAMAAWTRNRERTTSVRLMTGPSPCPHTGAEAKSKSQSHLQTSFTPRPLIPSHPVQIILHSPPPKNMISPHKDHAVFKSFWLVRTIAPNIAPQSSLLKDDSTAQFNFLSAF